MTIKIKAPRMWQYPSGKLSAVSMWEGERRVRIVSESDWRKLLALVRAVDEHVCDRCSKPCDIREALNALEKKK